MTMRKKPSVLFINRVYPPVQGATGRVLRDLARSFAKDGWDVTVLTTGQKSAKEMDGDVVVRRIRSNSKKKTALRYFFVWLRFLFVAFFMSKKDLVVTMTDPPMLIVVGRLVKWFKKSRHIHWCHDLYPDALPALNIRLPRFAMSYLKRLSCRSMKSCDKVIVIGRCIARHLTHTGVEPQKIAMIPNWPDYELSGKIQEPETVAIEAPANDEGELVGVDGKTLFIDNNPKFKVLYAGTLGREHPIQTILEAASILDKKYPEIEFVFVGGGIGQDLLARERARRGLNNIRLLPWQPPSRLKSMMESGDLHLVSMKHELEGLLVPSKVYSAFAAARPCILIGPDRSEAARVIKEFKAGHIVPQNDGDALAKVILGYRMDGEEWFKAHEGAAKAGKIYVPDESIKAWISRARDTIKAPLRKKVS